MTEVKRMNVFSAIHILDLGIFRTGQAGGTGVVGPALFFTVGGHLVAVCRAV